MKQNNYHIKKRMSPIETALLGNLIYIVLVLIFKGILDLMGNDGNYRIVFGVVEFVVMAGYWIILNWFLFRNPASHQDGSYVRYVLFSMLPILVFTIVSGIVIYITPGTEFTSAWNQFTFLVAPTIFWYLPFGVVYHFIGSSIPIVVYFAICLVLAVGFQIIGIFVASGRRKQLRERAKKRSVQIAKEEAIEVEKIAETYTPKPARKVQQPIEKKQSPKETRKNAEQVRARKINPKDPFDEGEQTQIIYTETFSPITDEMIEAVEKNKREYLEKQTENATQSSARKKQSKDLMEEIDIEAVSGAIRETSKGLKETQQASESTKQPEKILEKEKSETQNINQELEYIRRRMSQDKKNRRK